MIWMNGSAKAKRMLRPFTARLEKVDSSSSFTIHFLLKRAEIGRTGLMITAFLPYRYDDKIDVETSLQFYAERRTLNNKVIITS